MEPWRSAGQDPHGRRGRSVVGRVAAFGGWQAPRPGAHRQAERQRLGSARDNLARVGFGAPYAQKVHEKEPFLREAVQDAGLRARMLARMGEGIRF